MTYREGGVVVTLAVICLSFKLELNYHVALILIICVFLSYSISLLCPSSPFFLLLWSQQYDFSLEKRSVRWGLELAEAREAEARAEEAAAKQEAEKRECLTKAQDIDGGGGKNTRSAAEDQDPPPPALNPVLAGLRHNDILTPLPAPSLGPRKTQPSIPQPHSLNLADFEREEDPFDKLELKTLDDKEELRNILQSQPQPQPPPPSSVSPPEVSQPGSESRGNSPSPPSTNTSLSAKPGFTHKPNGLVALLDMDRVGHTRRAGYDTDDRPCNIRSLTFPKLSDSDPVRYSLLPAPIPAARQNLPNGSPPTIPKTQVIVAPEPPSHTKSGAPKPVRMSIHTAYPTNRMHSYADELEIVNQESLNPIDGHCCFYTRSTRGQDLLVCRAAVPCSA